MFKRFSALSLALLVLVASTGYSISTHLCGGKPVSYSLFGRPADCGTEEETEPGDHCQHPASGEENDFHAQKCCSNQTVIIPGIQQVAELVKKAIDAPVYADEDDSLFSFSPEFAFATSITPPFAGYRPPARTRDLSLLLLVFRI